MSSSHCRLYSPLLSLSSAQRSPDFPWWWLSVSVRVETDRQLKSPLSPLHCRMERPGPPPQPQPKYGRIVASERRLELRYLISEPDQPDTAQEVCVASWSVGDSNLVSNE